MPTAVIRQVPDSFPEAIVSGERPGLDVAAARDQHMAYAGALELAGYSVVSVAADEATPDCPFIEDTAVILRDVALMTRPGAESRRREVGPVGDALEDLGFKLEWMEAPATLDGGDVLVAGDYAYVGLSARTNREGADTLAEVATRQGLWAIAVGVGTGLHLKSSVNALDDGTVLLAPGRIDESELSGVDILRPAAGEEWAANVMALGDGSVLVNAEAGATAAIIERAGYRVRTLDIAEFSKADGGLTCLSLRY